MHDDKFCDFDMRLVLEEVKSHQSVMFWGKLSGVVVAEVGSAGGPVYLGVDLAGATSDPV